ncbi:MAG TPA: flagellar export chaperone FliS [Steroidobacteraceae bacterium]|nr:flagellar export chaperone FliS [Steroidobacteraceae bacterium]
MLSSQRAAAQYRAVRSQGLVSEASPVRLVQVVYEHILSELATAQGCMQRIEGNLPLAEVKAKCASMGRAIRLLAQLDATLDMERGGQIAGNLRALYQYMLPRLALANATNDALIVGEAISLVRKIKSGWDQIVTEQR